MPDILQEFIDEMRAKYGPLAQSVNGSYAPPFPGAPQIGTGQRFTGLGNDNQLQKDRVAGVVHEGEQVIEADMVNRAGGPANVRSEIEKLAGEEPVNGRVLPGYQFGTGSNVVKGYKKGTGSEVVSRTMPGYEEGTDDDVARTPYGTPINQKYAVGDIGIGNKKSSTGNVFEAGRIIDGTKDDPGEMVTDVKASGDLAEAAAGARYGKVDNDLTDTSGITGDITTGTKSDVKGPGADAMEEGFNRLGALAAGKSEATQMARESLETQLSQQEAAEKAEMRQESAQKGLSPELASMEEARLQRQQAATRAKAITEFETGAAERAEASAAKLAELGISAKGVELTEEQIIDKYNIDSAELKLAKETWGAEFNLKEKYWGLDRDKWLEQARQWGIEQSWEEYQWDNMSAADQKRFQLEGETIDQAERRFLWENQTENLKDALATGNFAEAEKIWSARGVNIDPKDIETSYQNDRLGDTVANIQSWATMGMLKNIQDSDGSIDYDKAMKDPFIKSQLEELAKIRGMEAGSSEFKSWAGNTLETISLANDPYSFGVHMMTDDSKKAYLGSLGFDKGVDKFSFAGVMGQEGLDLMITSLFFNNALGIDDTEVTANESDAWNRADPESDGYWKQFAQTTTTADKDGNNITKTEWKNSKGEVMRTVVESYNPTTDTTDTYERNYLSDEMKTSTSTGKSGEEKGLLEQTKDWGASDWSKALNSPDTINNLIKEGVKTGDFYDINTQAKWNESGLKAGDVVVQRENGIDSLFKITGYKDGKVMGKDLTQGDSAKEVHVGSGSGRPDEGVFERGGFATSFGDVELPDYESENYKQDLKDLFEEYSDAFTPAADRGVVQLAGNKASLESKVSKMFEDYEKTKGKDGFTDLGEAGLKMRDDLVEVFTDIYGEEIAAEAFSSKALCSRDVIGKFSQAGRIKTSRVNMEYVRPSGAAISVFTSFVLDGGLNYRDAYALTARMIGRKALEKAWKDVTNTDFDESMKYAEITKAAEAAKATPVMGGAAGFNRTNMA